MLPLMCCEDIKPDTSDGQQQVSITAGSDACSYCRDSQEVFRSFEVSKRQRWLNSEF